MVYLPDADCSDGIDNILAIMATSEHTEVRQYRFKSSQSPLNLKLPLILENIKPHPEYPEPSDNLLYLHPTRLFVHPPRIGLVF
jgi:hypothetical protein